MRVKKKLEEQVVQKFLHRCPYCDQPISYDQFDLRDGENEVRCPSCKKVYIKVVGDRFEKGFPRKKVNRKGKKRKSA
jgi:rubrerythrin